MEEILKVIKEAIKAECQSQEHYQLMAQNAKDPLVKSFFEELSRDEEEHANLLRLRYEAITKVLNKSNE